MRRRRPPLTAAAAAAAAATGQPLLLLERPGNTPCAHVRMGRHAFACRAARGHVAPGVFSLLDGLLLGSQTAARKGNWGGGEVLLTD